MKGYVNFRFFAWVQCMAIFITIPEPCTAPISTLSYLLSSAISISQKAMSYMDLPRKTLPRITKEMIDIRNNESLTFSAGPVNKANIFIWAAKLYGPADSPYAGGVFHLSIKLPEDYPNNPPEVKFLTKIYHPNINESGMICLSILKKTGEKSWLPKYSISQVLMCISTLLSDPNPDDPLVPEIGREYVNNRELFYKKARHFTIKHADV